ncbi:hypothetical protein KR009_005150, partial [Drosophila setifemur]
DAASMRWSNVICVSYNKSWVRFNECRLKAVSRQYVHFNLNITLIQSSTKEVRVHQQLFKRETGYKPFLMNSIYDACKFMRKPFDPIAIMIFKSYRKFTNINHTCPFTGHVFIKDLYLSTEVMRLPLPTVDYLLSIKWIMYRNTQLTTNISYQFVEDLIFK